MSVPVLDAVIRVLDGTLVLGERARGFDASTPLLGSIPELDSMAVVNVLTALEEQFGFRIADDEMSADIFATVGTLSEFVSRKLDG